LPYDSFDKFCGTSTGTGGLIAITLGRLRLTVDEHVDIVRYVVSRSSTKVVASISKASFRADPRPPRSSKISNKSS
jgi:hypothetical protein